MLYRTKCEINALFCFVYKWWFINGIIIAIIFIVHEYGNLPLTPLSG